jgi:hypothetical protein
MRHDNRGDKSYSSTDTNANVASTVFWRKAGGRQKLQNLISIGGEKKIIKPHHQTMSLSAL